MAKADYIPTADGDFDQWLLTFNTNLPGVAASVGISVAEVTQVDTLTTAWQTEYNGWGTKDAAARQQRAKKDQARVALEKVARPIIRRIKAHPAALEDLQQLLKIIGPEDTTDLGNAKPKLTAKVLPGAQVEISFGKTKADGVNIYAYRADGKHFLARDTESPYVDTRPLVDAGKAEVRRYCAVYVVNDTEVGQFSDDVSVTVAP
jgi:hypothetical protein